MNPGVFKPMVESLELFDYLRSPKKRVCSLVLDSVSFNEQSSLEWNHIVYNFVFSLLSVNNKIFRSK